MKVVYKNLKGVFTGEGFKQKNGRKILQEDSAFISGPVSILVDKNDKKILEVSKSKIKADSEIDCEGMFATAGLVDSHTHTLFGGARWNEFFMRWSGAGYAAINAAGGGIRKTFKDTRQTSDAELEEKFILDTKKMLAEGVRLLEVKSGYGESLEDEFRVLRLINKAKKDSEMEIMSTFLGLHAIPQNIDEKTWVGKAIEALKEVKHQNLADFADSFPEEGFFSLESARQFSKAAKDLGLKFKIHADEITHVGAAEMGSELGASSVDHLQRISDKALSMLSTSKTVATLLPATSFYLGIPYAPARKILDSGARVALASDYNPGTAPNSSLLFTTMLAASQMKFSPSEILCAVTYNGAGALERDSEYGLIAPGYSSDILFWDLKTNEYLEEIFLSGIRPKNV